MSDNTSSPLRGRTIAIPETREVEVFAAMLERRGANVVRCPMVAIRDAPDPQPVLRWSEELAAGACTDVILLTGEGLRRIMGCIEQHKPPLRERFIQALGRTRKITRGPKPARALRDLGLRPDIAAEVPTSEGVISALRPHDLNGRSVGLQLYGTDPNRPLVEFLQGAGASVRTVAPYVYADAADDAAVLKLLQQVTAGEIDAVAFTSTPQVERLFHVAPADQVMNALQKTIVAAVGPVVAETLRKHQIDARVMPEEAFFLKPLTSVLEEAFAARN
ncbi:MAG: uroporphyrinogen-III synthase [Sinobacteraceae bacterium]|nr:uroporphyrinogen-III synthase [Nevskiaceae bacterium]MBV8853302.1 uroporphyrinogen-III synthase [Nevskiaceae bacterium]MBV9911982.1 uroporphyrinogen-III synthase [Nevskiaceae bacterium]